MGRKNVTSQTHTDLKRSVLLEGSKVQGVVLFDQPTGFVKGRDKKGKPFAVRFGLCKGSSDIIGWKSTGGVAVFVALEVKVGRDKLSVDQINFIDRVKADGGIAGEVRSVDQALELLNE